MGRSGPYDFAGPMAGPGLGGAVVVSLNIEMSLEERCSQEAHAKISENPDQCKGYSSMEECIDEIVKQICGT